MPAAGAQPGVFRSPSPVVDAGVEILLAQFECVVPDQRANLVGKIFPPPAAAHPRPGRDDARAALQRARHFFPHASCGSSMRRFRARLRHSATRAQSSRGTRRWTRGPRRSRSAIRRRPASRRRGRHGPDNARAGGRRATRVGARISAAIADEDLARVQKRHPRRALVLGPRAHGMPGGRRMSPAWRPLLWPVLVSCAADFERGARMARRDDREYREYLMEEQRARCGMPRPKGA